MEKFFALYDDEETGMPNQKRAFDEATVRLKRNTSTRNIPVVISTAWTTACNVGDRVDRALDAGAAEILYKPFHLTMLRDVLRTYLLA
jgi:CheY-like chemotaxis protein